MNEELQFISDGRESRQHRALVATARLLRFNLYWSSELPTRIAVRKAAKAVRRPRPPVLAPPPQRVAGDLQVEPGLHAGWPVWTLRPAGGRRESERVVVYIHGGGYLAQIGPPHYRWAADVARRTATSVLVPIYPLAPAGTASGVVPALADLIGEVIAERGAGAVAVTGDSAGGGLALASVQELVRRGQSIPRRLVLISPWLDATLGDPASGEIDDPLLGVRGLRAAGRLWAAGLDVVDPRVSPLFGDLGGLPPTTVYTGTLDVLWPDSRRLAEAAARGRHDVSVHVWRGLVHNWPILRWLPEARAVRPDLLRALVGDLEPPISR